MRVWIADRWPSRRFNPSTNDHDQLRQLLHKAQPSSSLLHAAKSQRKAGHGDRACTLKEKSGNQLREEQGSSTCEHFGYHGRKTLINKKIRVNRVNYRDNLRINERLVRVDFLQTCGICRYVFVNIRCTYKDRRRKWKQRTQLVID